jgi:hypothetical protein
MNSSGILMLAVGLVAGLMLGQALKQCAPATPTGPAKNYWDAVIAGLPVAKDLLEDWF